MYGIHLVLDEYMEAVKNMAFHSFLALLVEAEVVPEVDRVVVHMVVALLVQDIPVVGPNIPVEHQVEHRVVGS